MDLTAIIIHVNYFIIAATIETVYLLHNTDIKKKADVRYREEMNHRGWATTPTRRSLT